VAENLSVYIIRNLSNVNDVEDNGKKAMAKQQLCTCITLFCTFAARLRRESADMISCFLEDVSTRQQLSFTFLNFDTYSLLEFNAGNFCQNLTN